MRLSPVEQGNRSLQNASCSICRIWSGLGVARSGRPVFPGRNGFLPPTTHRSVFEHESSVYINTSCKAGRGNMPQTATPHRALTCIRHKHISELISTVSFLSGGMRRLASVLCMKRHASPCCLSMRGKQAGSKGV